MKNKNKYPLDSAGSLMVQDVPIVKGDLNLEEVEVIIRRDINKFSTVNYIYIVDSQDKLIGVFSIKEFLRSLKTKRLKDLVHKNIFTVTDKTDKEKVAALALEKNLKAIPVLDDQGVFLGVVPSDTILKILHDESLENLLRLSGVSQEAPYEANIFHFTLLRSLKNRLPWLIVGLFGGLLAALVVSSFESVLNKNIILASFIPLVVYMSSAVGSQMQAFIIRDLALNCKIRFLQYLIRHTKVVFFIGLIVSISSYFMVMFFYQNYSVGVILATSLFLAIITSIITGLIIPFAFYKIELDPADASGPVATILQDILSILVYLSVAYFLI